jgi:hypothetical protein
MKHPITVKFENLGKKVNSSSADYYPCVSDNEGMLYFTSRRKETTGNQISSMGYFSSDIYSCKVVNGDWSKAKNLGSQINSAEDEECVSLSHNGTKMLLYVFHDETGADLFTSEINLKNKSFGRATRLPSPINSSEGEFEACYSNDGNTIFFVSDRKGGVGESDIYTCKKLPTGQWAKPYLLGNKINTIHKEAFPRLSTDGRVLYFASQGHNSMGGFDVFKSEWDSVLNDWGTAVNVGYPLNTTDDDMMFTVAANGRDGYVSCWKKDSYGDQDIYKVIFADAELPLTAVRGSIQSDNFDLSLQKGMTITLTDLNGKTGADTHKINPQSGRYIFIVPPGHYRLEVKGDGITANSSEVFVFDKSDYQLEKNVDISIVSPQKKQTEVKKTKF